MVGGRLSRTVNASGQNLRIYALHTHPLFHPLVGDNSAGSPFSFAPPLRRHLEIPLLTKLRALCLHSRLINSLISPTRRLFHVPSPISQAAKQKTMNWSTSVYTTLSSDTEPSIVITFDSAKYIFNAGENTSRAILQSGRGWRKVTALFLTRLGTQRSSGVPGVLSVSPLRILLNAYAVLDPGLFMSLADSKSRVMDVVGPKGLLHFFASMRFYVFRFVLQVYTPIVTLKLNPICRA